jgi:hypothetical protein
LTRRIGRVLRCVQMSTWAERYATHAVWEKLKALGPAIDAAQAREGIAIEQRDNLERIRGALTYVGKRLGAADPFVVQPPAIGIIAETVGTATEQLQAFVTDGDGNHVSNASTQLDSALHQCAIGVAVPTAAELEGSATQLNLYRVAMSKHLEGFFKQGESHAAALKAAESRLTELQTSFAGEQQRIAGALNDWQTQFNAAQAAREQQSTTLVTTLQDQFLTAQAAREQAHTDAQAARQSRFDELHTEHSKKLADRMIEFDKAATAQETKQALVVDTLQTKYEANAEAILAQIEGKQVQVEKLVGVIGDLGVTSGHKKAADGALRALRFWQTVAVAAMVSLIYIAFTKFLPAADIRSEANQGGFDWPAFAIRVYVSLTVGVLAAYAGTQADKYYRIERKNRKMALELEAIGPFLQPLPEAEQQKFRITIGDRSFGRDDDPAGDKPSPATVLHLLNVKDGRELLAEVVRLANRDRA